MIIIYIKVTIYFPANIMKLWNSWSYLAQNKIKKGLIHIMFLLLFIYLKPRFKVLLCCYKLIWECVAKLAKLPADKRIIVSFYRSKTSRFRGQGCKRLRNKLTASMEISVQHPNSTFFIVWKDREHRTIPVFFANYWTKLFH